MLNLVGHGIRCQGNDYEIIGVTGGDHYEEGGTTVFDEFDLSDYTFLQISRGGVYGNIIQSEHSAVGVFKLRQGMSTVNNQETRQSDATLHIQPSETWLGEVPENREFIRVTLQAADFSEYGDGS